MEIKFCSICGNNEFIFYEGHSKLFCYACYMVRKNDIKPTNRGELMRVAKKELQQSVEAFMEDNKTTLVCSVTQGLEESLFGVIDEKFREMVKGKLSIVIDKKIIHFVEYELSERIKFFYDSMQKEINEQIESKMKEEVKKYFNKTTPTPKKTGK